MQIKKANIKKVERKQEEIVIRPENFDDFIWQENIKNILKSWIISSIKRNDSLWHILFSWDSWFWKTSLSRIISSNLRKQIKIVTAYAIEKPSDIISILNQVDTWDVLFIDEIHRLKPKIEEILYIAMEDFRVDIVLQDETTSISINHFTLIWATNKLENLSDAFKNRFIYKFHLKPYKKWEKIKILEKYLKEFHIKCKEDIIKKLSSKTLPVPREIKNLSIRIRDYLIASWFKQDNLQIDEEIYVELINNLKLWEYWLSDLQKEYIKILQEKDIVWLWTLSSMLNVAEKVIEKDIEPILINLWFVEKTKKWRKLLKQIENTEEKNIMNSSFSFIN